MKNSAQQPVVVYAHGWATSNQFFSPLREQLGFCDSRFFGRDYFHTSCTENVSASQVGELARWIGIGHSLGFYRLAQVDLSHCVGLVSIGGFREFCSESGTDPRIIRRMIRQLDSNAQTVLEEFVRKSNLVPFACHSQAHIELLKNDLISLSRSDLGEIPVPVLALAGKSDQIVPRTLVQLQFENPIFHLTAGHELGWSNAQWCAKQIRCAFLSNE